MNQHIGMYIRVSTNDQSTYAQAEDMRFRVAEFESLGFDVRVYEDHFTGTTMRRPGWSRLDAEIKAGRIHTVLVWRLDRLGRTAAGLTTLFAELHANGINLISHKEGIDLSTPAGRLMANVIASMAQYETEVRQERQTLGIAAAKAAGKKWGGGKKGVQRRKTKAKAKLIMRLKAGGMKVEEIARVTKSSKPTVKRIITGDEVALGSDAVVESA